MTVLKKIKHKINSEVKSLKIRDKPKYFCIGNNKTGTTSIGNAFKELGFTIGNQRKAELLMDSYFDADYEPIIKYCRKAEVFQDVPFSCPNTFKILDKEFSNSKFILTIRDNSDQWYDSLTKFHAKLYGNGELPSWEKLREVDYVYKGWAYKNRQKLYGLSLNDNPYDKEKLIKHYEDHNKFVIDYFKNRPKDLLIINLAQENSYKKFCNFIGVSSEKSEFPWKNKTADL